MARRLLGTMIVHGFPRASLAAELELARWIGAELLEILPFWRREPDPVEARERARDAGFVIHSVHGSWGGESIRARRVDLGSPDPAVQEESVDDLRRCLDWLAAVGGRFLVVHPGGLSDEADGAVRRDSLARGLSALADHARGSGLVVAVENMPPGVHPGSRMKDLAGLLEELDRPELGLTIDVGHAHLVGDVPGETLAAGARLVTTHVHDNDGRQDAHHPPGRGGVDWPSWFAALDAIGYDGPIMLECIKRIRADRSVYDRELFRPFLRDEAR